MTASLDKVSFLLVDDNAHMLKLIVAMLSGFGAKKIYEAKDANAAFAKLRETPVDIIILDYVMEEEDGVAFMRRLRQGADTPNPYTPVIMLTAHSERGRVEAARDAGVNEFCRKPLSANELHRKIAAVIDNPRNFIKTGVFLGPDRRRREDPNFTGTDRRGDRGGDRAGDPSMRRKP